MMIKLKQVGFFKELAHGDPHAASLSESKNQLKDDLVKNISGYLESGILFIASHGLVKDILSENKEIIGTLGVFTDGIWFGILRRYLYQGVRAGTRTGSDRESVEIAPS
jgi:hypothetical protein